MARRALEIVITGDSRGASRAFRGVERDAGTLTGRLQGVGSAAARTFGILGGAYAVGQGVRKITTDTVNFDKSMRNVNSIAQLNEKQYEKLSDAVLKLAGPTAQAPQTLADGLYDLVSSGFDAEDSLKVLGASARAATAGLTTTEVSTKAVAAVLNAYRQPAGKAKDVSDVLFRTVDRGVISFEDLASTVGDVLPFASSLGVSLREVGASTATMTKAGIGAPETMTRIKNVMTTMLKPGTALKQTLRELGFETGEAIIEQKGFQGALDAIVKTAGGSKEAVAALFPNIRSLGGVLALTGENSKNAAEDLRGMNEAAGATGKALAEQSKSISFQWQQLQVAASVLSIEIGKKLAPAFREVFAAINDPKLTNADKLKALGGVVSDQLAKMLEKVPDLIAKITPEVLKVSLLVGKSLVEGVVNGFLQTDVLGKLLMGAAAIRIFGGRGALMSAGRSAGKPVSMGFANGFSGGLTTFLGAAVLSGGVGKAVMGSTAMARFKGYGKELGKKGLALGAVLGLIGGIQQIGSERQRDTRETIRDVLAGAFNGVGLGGLIRGMGFEDFGKTTAEHFSEAYQQKLSELIAQGGIVPQINLDKQAGLMNMAQDMADRLVPDKGATEEAGRKWQEAVDRIFGRLRSAFDSGRYKNAEELFGTDLWSKMNPDEKTLAESLRRTLIQTGRLASQGIKIPAPAIEADPEGVRKAARTIADGFRFLKGDVGASLADVMRVSERSTAAIAETLGKNTNAGRVATAKNLRATAAAIRRGMDSGVISTRNGTARIRELLQQAKLAAPTRKQAMDMGREWAKGMDRNREITKRGVDQMLAEARKLPVPMRKIAVRSWLSQLKEARKGGDLTADAYKRLRSRVLSEFTGLVGGVDKSTRRVSSNVGDLGRSARTGMTDLNRALSDGERDASRKLNTLSQSARRHSRNVKTAITGIPGPARTAYSKLGEYTNAAAAAFGSDKQVELAFRGGGQVYASGGTVPAMVSPGERVDYKGRSWTVPGKPEPRDSVFAQLPVGASVLTFDGQARMAMGASRQEAVRKQLPHFGDGGWVQNLPRPKLSGGNSTSTATGNSAISSIRQAALEWIKKLGGPRSLQAVIKAANRIDALKLPYVWGGGHGSTPAPANGPFDCSSAISRVLQESGWSVPTSVSGTMAGWGQPGRGPVTIMANPEHVYGIFGGRAWGTSGENPDGGAGWIDGYVTRPGFAVRHMPTSGTGQAPAQGFRDGGQVVTGRVSWFNGPSSSTASGLPVSKPGLALNLNPGTDSGWNNSTTDRWMALAGAGNPVYGRTTIAGKTANLPIIDKGPSGYTGRAIDVTEAGVRKLGLNPATFPTDSIGKVRILGSGGGGGGKEKEKPEPKLTAKQKRARRTSRRKASSALSYAKAVQDRAKNKELSKKAVAAGKKAVSLTKEGEFTKGNKWTRKAKALAENAAKSIPGLKGSRPPFGVKGKGFDASDPFSSKNLPGFKSLPKNVQKLLMSPGLSWQAKRDLATSALEQAGLTKTKRDDAAALNLTIGLEKKRRKNAQRQFRKANSILARGGLTRKQQSRWVKRRDSALDVINQANSELGSARQQIRDLRPEKGTADTGEADLASAMKELAKAIRQQNELQSSVQATGSREALRMLGDVISGEIVGKRAGVPAQTGVRY